MKNYLLSTQYVSNSVSVLFLLSILIDIIARKFFSHEIVN